MHLCKVVAAVLFFARGVQCAPVQRSDIKDKQGVTIISKSNNKNLKQQAGKIITGDPIWDVFQAYPTGEQRTFAFYHLDSQKWLCREHNDGHSVTRTSQSAVDPPSNTGGQVSSNLSSRCKWKVSGDGNNNYYQLRNPYPRDQWDLCLTAHDSGSEPTMTNCNGGGNPLKWQFDDELCHHTNDDFERCDLVENCFNTRISVEHCGECGTECGPGETCGSYECKCGNGPACLSNQECCNGDCVDPDAFYLANHDNCGSCGNSCGSEETCCDRGCRQPSFFEQHNGHCGACSGATTPGNACNVMAGESCCDSDCRDPAFFESSDSNCAGCGNACPDGSFCTMAQCVPGSRKNLRAM